MSRVTPRLFLSKNKSFNKKTRRLQIMEISKKILSNITVYMKYAKYMPEKERPQT